MEKTTQQSSLPLHNDDGLLSRFQSDTLHFNLRFHHIALTAPIPTSMLATAI